MFYRPEFCCDCGEKIERADWRLLTSRRFCDLCATKHQLSELAPKVLIVLVSVLGIVGFANYLQTPHASGPLPAKRGLADRSNTQASPNFKTTEPVLNQSQNRPPADEANISGPVPVKGKARPDPVADKTEAVYYCGAETRKGTPCTRKVKGNVRCWQHKGMPAILPAAKLIASN